MCRAMNWLGVSILAAALAACSAENGAASGTYPGGNPSAVWQYSTNPYAGGNAPPTWGGPVE
jgi:hypothetical protein